MIDYACSDLRSDWMDIFLCAQCRFFIGCQSGLSAVPSVFGVPVVMTDLRMGQTPWFVFSFIVAERDGESIEAVPAVQVPTQRPPASALPWLWRRIWDENARYSSQTREM